mgnify:CR=1 FL=1
MTELTRDYLDKQLDIIDERAEKRMVKIVGELKSYTDLAVEKLTATVEQEIEDLASMTNRGFEDITKQLDVRERLEKLEKKMERVHKALNL